MHVANLSGADCARWAAGVRNQRQIVGERFVAVRVDDKKSPAARKLSVVQGFAKRENFFARHHSRRDFGVLVEIRRGYDLEKIVHDALADGVRAIAREALNEV